MNAALRLLAVAALAITSATFPLQAASTAGTPEKTTPVSSGIQTFLSTFCIDCHDDATRKGDVSLEALGGTVTGPNARGWLRALEQIERGTMPPPKKKQPSERERLGTTLELESVLAKHAQSAAGREPTVFRRLNRTEYRRTLEDLLHLNLNRRDPTVEFPEDTRSHGFASNGDKLVTSSFLLRHYLNAAKDVVGRAVHFEAPPETRTWALSAPFDRTSLGHRYAEREWYTKRLRQPQPYQTLEYRDGSIPLEDLRDGVPVSGWYNIRILAEAKFRYADMDAKKMFGGGALLDPSQPHQLAMTLSSLVGIDPANKDAVRDALIGSYGDNVASGKRAVAVWDVPDDVPTWLECRVWLDAGQFPRFSYPNGPTNSNYRITGFVKDNRYTLLDKKQLAAYEEANLGGDWGHLLFFETPRIRLHKAELSGPLNEQWPPASHRAIFGAAPYTTTAAPEVVRAFAERAWRRPVTAETVAPIVEQVRSAEKEAVRTGMHPQEAAEEAITTGVRAVLCAPEFLFREERGETLDGHETASRLSYFLWSSLPDDALLGQAASGALSSPKVRHREALRLLADPRADTFIDEFLDGWLTLRKLGSIAPRFPDYLSNDPLEAMRKETRLYFKHLLHTNGPIADLLDSNYTFVNRALARHYKIDWTAVESNLGQPVAGLSIHDLQPDGAGSAPSQGFVRVALTDKRRGGLLGHASVLTVTANGVDTSPVVRGAWLLENILGAPPSPPPPNVPVIEPDTRGTTTLRERLQKHRDNPSCLNCHRQIDPPGFALESFDAIGGWRGHYQVNDKTLPVDPSGEFAGASFQDVTGFKELLLKRQPQFARCLVEKLLTHALGRELNAGDRPAIRTILNRAAADGYRLRDLVVLCCESELLTGK
jgi:hypothetical protein